MPIQVIRLCKSIVDINIYFNKSNVVSCNIDGNVSHILFL